MKTSLIRAFLFSLILFFIINFLIVIISYSVAGYLDLHLATISIEPLIIIVDLIHPIGMFPWEAIQRSFNSIPGFNILYMGFVISLAVASIIAGIFGGSLGKSIIGWILTSVTCIGVFILLISISTANLSFYCFMCSLEEGIIEIFITGISNMLIFGILTSIIAVIKGRSST